MNTEPISKPNVRDGAVAASKETLVTDLKTVAADANDLIKEAAGATAQEFSEARTKFGEKLGEARAAVTGQVRCAARATDGYVKDHPWTVLGIAAVAGLVIGSLLSRR